MNGKKEDVYSIKSIKELRLEYWTKRLDHALNHMLTASKLIYLVDGAVLALIYFIADRFAYTRQFALAVFLVFLILAIINYLHSEFLRIQNHNYQIINKRILKILGESSEENELQGKFVIKWNVYRLIHIIIAFALFIVFIFMLLYGLGYFPNITLPTGNKVISYAIVR